MKKQLFIILSSLLVSSFSCANTTYIPTYRSFIQIVNCQNDTATLNNNLDVLEMTDEYNMFRISIVHEDITKEKVKAIKKAKAAAGWMMAAAIMSNVSSAIERDRLSSYISSENAGRAAALAEILDMDANDEQTLAIEVWIDNLSTQELLVADLEHGLTWYVQPHNSLSINLSNPGMRRLRISDIHHQIVQYAMPAAGSSLKKETIEWEDDDCWIVGYYYDETFHPMTPKYEYIDKETFEKRAMSSEELRNFKKQMKDLQSNKSGK